MSAVELMRVWVLSLISNLLDELLSVVSVLSGIENLLGGFGLASSGGWLFRGLLLLLLLLCLLLFSQLLSGLKLTTRRFSTLILCGSYSYFLETISPVTSSR